MERLRVAKGIVSGYNITDLYKNVNNRDTHLKGN